MAKRRKLGQAVALASALVLNEATLEAPSKKVVAAGGAAPPPRPVKQDQWSGGIKFNLLAPGGKLRHDSMEGKEYLVVPVVMITEGVHNGSGGPLYYPPEELGKTPESWNLKPIVVYHPEEDGRGISACQPHVVNSSKIGWIVNARWEAEPSPGRLKAEAWIDEARADEVDPRIMANVRAGKMVEVSTGLFTDNEDAQGLWRGETYSAVARNYRPDHLAILPDQRGSCSIADGAGLNRNKAAGGEDEEVTDNAWTDEQRKRAAERRKKLADDFHGHMNDTMFDAGPKHDDQKSTVKVALKQHAEGQESDEDRAHKFFTSRGMEGSKESREYVGKKYGTRASTSYDSMNRFQATFRNAKKPPTENAEPTANEISFEDTRRAIYDGLDAKYGKNSILSIEATYEDFFVFANQGKLFCQAYDCNDDGTVDFTGIPTEVSKVTQYRDGEGEVVGNAFEVEDDVVLTNGDCSGETVVEEIAIHEFFLDGEGVVVGNAWTDEQRKKAADARKGHAQGLGDKLGSVAKAEHGDSSSRVKMPLWGYDEKAVHEHLEKAGFVRDAFGDYEHARDRTRAAVRTSGDKASVAFKTAHAPKAEKKPAAKKVPKIHPSGSGGKGTAAALRPLASAIDQAASKAGVPTKNAWTDEARKKAVEARKGHSGSVLEKFGGEKHYEDQSYSLHRGLPPKANVASHLESRGFKAKRPEKHGKQTFEHADGTLATVTRASKEAEVDFQTHPKVFAGSVKNSAFDELAKKLGKQKGVTDPKALAAKIGREKYGRAGMAAKAAAGKKKAEDEPVENAKDAKGHGSNARVETRRAHAVGVAHAVGEDDGAVHHEPGHSHIAVGHTHEEVTDALKKRGFKSLGGGTIRDENENPIDVEHFVHKKDKTHASVHSDERYPGAQVVFNERDNVGGSSGDSSQDSSNVDTKEDVQMNRAALIVALIANSGGDWTDADKNWLEVQSLDRLVKLNSAYATGEGTETGDDEEGNQTGIAPGGKKKAAKKAKLEDGEINSEGDDEGEVEDETPAKKPAATTKNASVAETVEDYLKKAPAAVATILNRQLRKEQSERASLIKSITANARCRFTAEQLAKWDSEDLVKLAQGFVDNEDSTKEPLVNYAGLGEGFAPDVTTNAEEPLGLPSYDYTKK